MKVNMKISGIKPYNIYPKPNQSVCSHTRLRESAYANKIENSENINQINTTIKTNSDGRASFKGGSERLILHEIAEFVHESPLVAEAIFAILITCGLRPLTIMATAKGEENKEKSSYQAAKSISSGLVGLAMTTLVGTPIAMAAKRAEANGAFKMPPEMREKSMEVVKNGVETLKGLSERLASEGREAELVKQIEKLTEGGKINFGAFKGKLSKAQKLFLEQIKEVAPETLETVKTAFNQQKVINNYARTGKNVIDKLFQPVFMPLRATITIALVPVLLNLLGKKKPEKKPESTPQTILKCNVFDSDSNKNIFQPFAEVTKNAN